MAPISQQFMQQLHQLLYLQLRICTSTPRLITQPHLKCFIITRPIETPAQSLTNQNKPLSGIATPLGPAESTVWVILKKKNEFMT